MFAPKLNYSFNNYNAQYNRGRDVQDKPPSAHNLTTARVKFSRGRGGEGEGALANELPRNEFNLNLTNVAQTWNNVMSND